MLSKIAKQIQNVAQPFNEVMSINAKAIEQLTQQNAALFTDMIKGNVAFAQGITEQKDIAGVVNAQKAYVQGVQGQLVSAAKESYSVIAETQEKAGDVLKGTFSQVQETAKKATKAAAKAAK